MRVEYYKGFTLIELVIGMVVFSIVMLVITSLIAPQSKRSIDPIWQARAAELGQSFISEIQAKSFDENSSRSGGSLRCNEGTPCTSSSALGPDVGETRIDFNDVDDFAGLSATGSAIQSAVGATMTADGVNLYQGFSVDISVVYDDNEDGHNDDDSDGDGVNDTGTYVGNVKLITVTVTTPGGDAIPFTLYKWNF